jgi:hypothetical protein
MNTTSQWNLEANKELQGRGKKMKKEKREHCSQHTINLLANVISSLTVVFNFLEVFFFSSLTIVGKVKSGFSYKNYSLSSQISWKVSIA